MRTQILLSFLLIKIISSEDFEETKVIKICDVCTCSELSLFSSDVYLNIFCKDTAKIVSMPDFDKIEWPENKHRLKVNASFVEVGFTTLGKLPPNSYIEILSFPNNTIKHYWPDPFTDVTNLRSLSLSANELETITLDLFTGISNLEELYIERNKLTTIEKNALENMAKLRKISLLGNGLKSIPIEAMGRLEALEELDLSDNNIYDVLMKYAENDTFVNLRRLNLNRNNVRTLTKDAFLNNNSLEDLRLSHNKIESIEEDTFIPCVTLTELDLSMNNITFNFVIPNSVRVINLSHNTIHRWPTLPPEISYADLSFNRLSDLFPNDINYEFLEILNLAGNQIKHLTVPTIFPKLYDLNLRENLLEELPEDLSEANFPNLRELRLDGNPIHVIYFKNIISLRYLHMDKMYMLYSIGEKAFSNVMGRQDDGERECYSLSLAGSQLESIEDGAFEGNKLCSLDLSENNFTTISSSLLEWTSLPDGVNLQNNPWDCGCHLQWILDSLLPHLYKEHAYLLSDLRCQTPRGVSGLRMVHWYNWTERAMCTDVYMKSGPNQSYVLEPKSADIFGSFTSLSLILGVAIIIVLLIAIGLTVYLMKTRREYRVKQAAMRRKRQNARDVALNDIVTKDQYKALNKS